MTSEQYVAMPKNLVYLGFYSCTCDLYTLSLLTSLNARGSLRNIHTDVNSIRLQSHPLSDFRTSGAIEFSTGAASGKSVSPVVHVSRTTTVQDDVCSHLFCLSIQIFLIFGCRNTGTFISSQNDSFRMLLAMIFDSVCDHM
jgi:hypothetical protein